MSKHVLGFISLIKHFEFIKYFRQNHAAVVQLFLLQQFEQPHQSTTVAHMHTHHTPIHQSIVIHTLQHYIHHSTVHTVTHHTHHIHHTTATHFENK